MSMPCRSASGPGVSIAAVRWVMRRNGNISDETRVKVHRGRNSFVIALSALAGDTSFSLLLR